MNWLDTQTKEILQKVQEPKPAPPKTGEFALIMIRKGTDQQRLVRAVRRINNCTEAEAVALARSSGPVTINPGLTEEEALFGQFELICCDAIAAFIRSEVFEQNESAYIQCLLDKVLQSPEFKPTKIAVLEVPTTEAGQRFADQFLGKPLPAQTGPASPLVALVPFKKARIMMHWARRVGARVKLEATDIRPT